MTWRRWSVLASCLAGTALLATCKGSTAPSVPADLPEYITVKRAWLPGERDSLLARIQRDHSLVLPYAGDISDLAPQLYADRDSVVVIIRNPALPSPRISGVFLAPGTIAADSGPAFDSTWTVIGFDIRTIDNSQSPADTVIDVLATFWSKVGLDTYHGWILADRCHAIGGAGYNTCMSTRPPTTKSGGYVPVNTATFDAGFAKTGAGGGQYRQTTGEYWEANSGNFEIKSGSYGTDATVTSGPYTGGLRATGSVKGDLNSVNFPKVLPSAGLGFKVTLDFRTTAIPSVRLTCIFPTPCTGP